MTLPPNLIRPRADGFDGSRSALLQTCQTTTKLPRAFIRMVAWTLISVFLFAQLSISAYACPSMSLAMQASQQSQAGDNVAAASPCSDMAGPMDPDFANLCAEHCKYGQQIDHAATVKLPAAVLVALYAIPVVAEAALPIRDPADMSNVQVATSPPHAILHCVFRI